VQRLAAVTDTPRLTWHRGSILPYASLWHTLHRACQLNGLRPRQFITLTAIREHRWPRGLPCRIDRGRFAAVLGEPHEALRWSTLDDAPAWLQTALFSSAARVCPLCLAAGYHTDLFALHYLQTCPIHAVPLRPECGCGRPFLPTLSLPDGIPGSCPCDRLRFFTPELCRRPRMTPAEMGGMNQLVSWLDAMPRLAQSEAVAGQPSWARRLEPEEISAVCEAMGFPYPPGFAPRPAISTLRIVRGPSKVSRVVCRERQTTSSFDLTAQTQSYWPQAPLFAVYRAMARHFRRHVVPRTATWLARIFGFPHPGIVADKAARYPQATLVITECFWAYSVEQHVDLRRWPYRAPPPGVFGELNELVMRHACVSRPNLAFCAKQDRTWLAYHAAAATLLQLWDRAEQRVGEILHDRLFSSDPSAIWRTPLRPWWGTTRRDNALRIVEPVTSCSRAWGPVARADKAARRRSDINRRERRKDGIVAQWQTQGAGLTFSAETGWAVATALEPASTDIRRRRLHDQDVATRFWIYRNVDGGFVARLCDGRIQAEGETAGAAILALHRAIGLCRRLEIVVPTQSRVEP